MAIKLSNKTNTIVPNGDYPFGAIKDESAPGSNDGTPINTNVYGDFHQFFEKMMDFGIVTHNNLPDNESNGYQLFTSFLSSINLYVRSLNYSAYSEASDMPAFDNNPAGGESPTTGGSITLPNDGVSRNINVIAKANWNQLTGGATNITGRHYLYLNSVEVDVSITESSNGTPGIRNYDDTTTCIYSFSHAGNGGVVDHRFWAINNQYDITDIKLNIIGLPV